MRSRCAPLRGMHLTPDSIGLRMTWPIERVTRRDSQMEPRWWHVMRIEILCRTYSKASAINNRVNSLILHTSLLELLQRWGHPKVSSPNKPYITGITRRGWVHDLTFMVLKAFMGDTCLSNFFITIYFCKYITSLNKTWNVRIVCQ